MRGLVFSSELLLQVALFIEGNSDSFDMFIE